MADIFIRQSGQDSETGAASGERIRRERPTWSLFYDKDNIRAGQRWQRRLRDELTSCRKDGNTKLWPKEGTGEPLILSHGSPVWSLAALANGRLASGGGEIKLWLVDEQKLIAALCLRAGRSAPTLPGSRAVAASLRTGVPQTRNRSQLPGPLDKSGISSAQSALSGSSVLHRVTDDPNGSAAILASALPGGVGGLLPRSRQNMFCSSAMIASMASTKVR
jgi:hypothetical protein